MGEDKTGLSEENLHTPNGQADDYAAAAAYDADIRDNGGVYLQILASAPTVTLDLNEPGVSTGLAHTRRRAHPPDPQKTTRAFSKATLTSCQISA